MTADELRKLQRAHERAEQQAAKVTAARNEGIYEALREGRTHAWVADAMGLSRGLVSKYAKRLSTDRPQPRTARADQERDTMTATAITANPHDNGYDIVAGPDITGAVIGCIYMQEPGRPDADAHGLCMELIGGNGDGYQVDDAPDAARIILEETGRELTAESINDIASLA